MTEKVRRSVPIELDPGREPWAQQPRESSKQYERFLLYRDSGRVRSLIELNKALTDSGDKLTYNTIRVQSHLFRWAERVRAWDAHCDELKHAMAVRHQEEMDERLRKIVIASEHKAARMLRDFDESKCGMGDLVRLLKYATDLDLRLHGEPTHRVAVTGPAGGPILTEDISGLTDKEYEIRMKEIAIEMARRSGLTVVENDEEEL